MILLKVNKSLQIYFHCNIMYFSLLVNLRVECSKKFPFYTKKKAKQWAGIQNENRVFIYCN